jgi:hypothetical protein
MNKDDATNTMTGRQMSDASNAVKNLRERLSGSTEERLGKALSDLLENPLLTGVVGRAFDARERAVQAQELAMGALNIPSAADIERLTRRLRSVSHRLEGIEDGVHRLDRALTPGGVEARLSAIEERLGTLTKKLGEAASSRRAAAAPPTRKPAAATPPARKPAAATSPTRKPAAAAPPARKPAAAAKSTRKPTTRRPASGRGVKPKQA